MSPSQYLERFNSLQSELKKYPQHPEVIAVSKYVGSEEIKAAYEAGFRDFGENRVPDLMEKVEALRDSCPDIRWHFIGNIQSNKIKDLMSIPELYSIHSLDSFKHLKMIGERAIRPVKIFIQVNTSDENQKGGIRTHDELNNLIDEIGHYPYLFFEGLMTMASLDGDLESARNSFQKLTAFSKERNSKFSMGMSGDYQVALEEGSHYVRIGSMIFR